MILVCQAKLTFAIILLVSAGTPYASENIHHKVNYAFSAVQKGDLSRTGELVQFGDAVVNPVLPYLKDKSELVRLEAVAILAAIGSDSANIALVTSLDDPSSDIREKASIGLYTAISIQAAKPVSGMGEILERGIKLGEPSAAALLLLGDVKEGEALLHNATHESRSVKLTNSDLPVDISLIAHVVLSRRGNTNARQIVSDTINEGHLENLLLFLKTIEMIDAPSLLHLLANKTLNDMRETADGVPAGVIPARRIADKAVEAFIIRLKLETDFSVKPSQLYTSNEIKQIKKLISQAIPD